MYILGSAFLHNDSTMYILGSAFLHNDSTILEILQRVDNKVKTISNDRNLTVFQF